MARLRRSPFSFLSSQAAGELEGFLRWLACGGDVVDPGSLALAGATTSANAACDFSVDLRISKEKDFSSSDENASLHADAANEPSNSKQAEDRRGNQENDTSKEVGEDGGDGGDGGEGDEEGEEGGEGGEGVGGITEGLDLPTRFTKNEPGSSPGIELRDLDQLPSQPQSTTITCIDYSPDQVHVVEIDDVEDFIIHHRPDWATVRWINIDGLSDLDFIRALAIKYELHPLAIEDVLHVGQRPKVDGYTTPIGQVARLLVIARMLQIIDSRLLSEQISMFLGHKTVLTFQESKGDVWDPIRQRINSKGSRIRTNDASFLVYSLLDAIVDHCFPILEHYGDELEDLEDRVLAQPSRDTIQEIHRIKRELLLLRRAVWPMREVVHQLQREPHECMSQTTQTYLRDVYDHTVQIIDIIETYREVATGLTETYMTSMSNRLNEVMKVLTIIGTIFIPLTFLAGVYGMNMPIPENHWEWSYAMFWVICLAVAGGMLYWFRRRGWL